MLDLLFFGHPFEGLLNLLDCTLANNPDVRVYLFGYAIVDATWRKLYPKYDGRVIYFLDEPDYNEMICWDTRPKPLQLYYARQMPSVLYRMFAQYYVFSGCGASYSSSYAGDWILNALARRSDNHPCSVCYLYGEGDEVVKENCNGPEQPHISEDGNEIADLHNPATYLKVSSPTFGLEFGKWLHVSDELSSLQHK